MQSVCTTPHLLFTGLKNSLVKENGPSHALFSLYTGCLQEIKAIPFFDIHS